MKYLICIPTYNEAENIANLINTIANLRINNLDILVIDDNSPDGTSQIVKKIAKSVKPNKVFVLDRFKKQGLGKAYMAGFSWGLKRNYDYLVSMDADFSHDPKYLPRLLKLSKNHDVVIGSRYIKGGKITGWNWYRYLNSYGANFFTKMILGLKPKDVTAGYKCYSARFLRSIVFDKMISSGYAFQVEMIQLAQNNKFIITETPIVFADRRVGQSKISGELSASAKTVLKLARKNSSLTQFIKFSMVGVLGTIIDLGFFNLLAIIFGANIYIARSISFVLAATNNYIWNRVWTFRSGSKQITKEYIKFFTVSVIGLAMNLGIMKILEPLSRRFSSEFIQKNTPVIIAILFVLIWNFIANKFWTFKEKK